MHRSKPNQDLNKNKQTQTHNQQVSDVQYKVLSRVTLSLVDTIPCIGGAQLSLLEVPHMDFKLRVLGGVDMMAVPGVKDATRWVISVRGGRGERQGGEEGWRVAAARLPLPHHPSRPFCRRQPFAESSPLDLLSVHPLPPPNPECST